MKAQSEGQEIQEYEGSEQLIDVPVNMRRRLKDTDLGNTHCAFLITEITTKVGHYSHYLSLIVGMSYLREQ